jgi:hypothetical protein
VVEPCESAYSIPQVRPGCVCPCVRFDCQKTPRALHCVFDCRHCSPGTRLIFAVSLACASIPCVSSSVCSDAVLLPVARPNCASVVRFVTVSAPQVRAPQCPVASVAIHRRQVSGTGRAIGLRSYNLVSARTRCVHCVIDCQADHLRARTACGVLCAIAATVSRCASMTRCVQRCVFELSGQEEPPGSAPGP